MELNKYIDHTKLGAYCTEESIIQLCKEAREYKFKSVCINPCFIPLAKQELEGSDVLVCTVIGFPHGATTTETKVFETKDAIKKGADEIDMVINVSDLKNGHKDRVLKEIKKIKKACGERVLKVIIETALLTKEEIKLASKLVVRAKADFVKTSTGFAEYGARFEDVALMVKTVKGMAEVKASGGVKNKLDAEKMIELGATRIGTSKGMLIVKGEEGDSNSAY